MPRGGSLLDSQRGIVFILSRWLLAKVFVILIAGCALLVQTFFTSHVIVLYLLITSSIATGLPMCRLRGVISVDRTKTHIQI